MAQCKKPSSKSSNEIPLFSTLPDASREVTREAVQQTITCGGNVGMRKAKLYAVVMALGLALLMSWPSFAATIKDPVEARPACEWSKGLRHGVYRCRSDSPAVFTGSYNTRDCGIRFYSGKVRIRRFHVSVIGKNPGADPFKPYAIGISHGTDDIGIRFPSQNVILDANGKPRPSKQDYVCRARVKISIPQTNK
jgi:hypothetical protein